MKKLYLLLLLPLLLLAACSDDDKPTDREPVFVTNIRINPSGSTFSPGDEVTITADGLEAGDDVTLDIYWTLTDNPHFSEGSSRYQQAVVTAQTATSITILTPGHYPASRVELYLTRQGERQMLGEISIADGQSPEELQLYGINTTRWTNRNSIEHIDPETDADTEILRLGNSQVLSCVVNLPGSNLLCGIVEEGGQRTVAAYDLSMRHWNPDYALSGSSITPITLIRGSGSLSELFQTDEVEGLYLADITPTVYSRTSPVTPPSFSLPQGMKAEALQRFPGIYTDGFIFLSADNGDGTFSPVILSLTNRSVRIPAPIPIHCQALIPFWMPTPREDGNGYHFTAGYAISAFEGGDSRFCFYNPETAELEEPFATFPNNVLSVDTYALSDRPDEWRLFVLFEGTRSGHLIETYDLAGEAGWQSFGMSYTFSEIVLAR